jgi:hypothetical protein
MGHTDRRGAQTGQMTRAEGQVRAAARLCDMPNPSRFRYGRLMQFQEEAREMLPFAA